MHKNLTFKQYDDPPPDVFNYVRNQFLAFNDQQCGVFPSKALNIFVHTPQKELIAGLIGDISWSWLHVDILWIAEPYRRDGIGTSLMDQAEAEAIRMGVNKAYLETTDFQALDFYKKRGYQVFAQLDDQPPGHICYYLKHIDLSR